jgi:SAM-dependent methyltransferase
VDPGCSSSRHGQESKDEVIDPSPVAQGYDTVYEAMPRSPTLLRIWREVVAGEDYPDDFSHISFVTLDDLRTLARALSLSPHSTFADVACGMGGPGLWIAKETGARLAGVDFSRVAVSRATERAEGLGMASQAQFSVGSFAETGLEPAAIDAAMSIDALQYAPDKWAALREFAQIVRPSGRLAFFAFELHPERSRGLPVIGEDPVGDYRPLLKEAGFRVLSYDQTPRWHDRLFAAYGAVIDAQDVLRQEMGDLATTAMLSEMTLTLDRDIYSGRVLAVAERT